MRYSAAEEINAGKQTMSLFSSVNCSAAALSPSLGRLDKCDFPDRYMNKDYDSFQPCTHSFSGLVHRL